MTARHRAARLAALVAAMAAMAAPAAAADPAVRALAERDAYVSPRVLGTAAPAAEATLAEIAAGLRADRRPVTLAVVLGPVGAPSLQAYARGLASRLGIEGTLLVTRRRGPVAAVGPRPTAEMTLLMRSAEVGAIANPVERLSRAAELVVPRLPDDGGSVQPAATLLVLGLLGGGWAVAMGAGRTARRERRTLAERRARVRVRLDALRAHAIHLAGLPGLPEEERGRVQATLGAYAEVVAAASEARTTADAAALDARIDAGLATLSAVAGRVGSPHPRPGEIFAGLCAADPGHGAATGVGEVDGLAGAAVCGACEEAAAAGVRLIARRVPDGPRSAPFAPAATDLKPGVGPSDS